MVERGQVTPHHRDPVTAGASACGGGRQPQCLGRRPGWTRRRQRLERL